MNLEAHSRIHGSELPAATTVIVNESITQALTQSFEVKLYSASYKQWTKALHKRIMQKIWEMNKIVKIKYNKTITVIQKNTFKGARYASTSISRQFLLLKLVQLNYRQSIQQFSRSTQLYNAVNIVEPSSAHSTHISVKNLIMNVQ